LSKQKKKSKSPKTTSIPVVDKKSANQCLENWLANYGKWVILLGWLFFLILYLSLASNELGGVLGGDNVRYLMLARSLAEGKFYKDLYLPKEPAHTQYPILFPLLLSPFAKTSHQVFYSHLFIQLLASLIPLFACAWARLEGESRLKSILIFFLVGSIPAFYTFLLNILTEAIFMFFMFGFFFGKSYSQREGFNPMSIFILIILLVASALVREAGLVLSGAVILGMILEKPFQNFKIAKLPVWFIIGLGFVLGYLPWQVRNMLVGEPGFYFQQFLQKNPYQANSGLIGLKDLIERIVDNLPLHIPHLGGFAFPQWLFRSPAVIWTVSLIFFGLIILGLGYRLSKRKFSVELSFLFLFLLSLVWFFKEARFSLPILPLCPFYFLKGMEWIENKLKLKIRLALLGGIVLAFWQIGLCFWLGYMYHQTKLYPSSSVLIKGYGSWNQPVIDVSKYYEYWLYPEAYHQAMSEWIIIQKIADEILPKDAVIACRKPTIAWYYAKRKATWYKFGVSPEEQWKHLKENNITHLIITPDNRELIFLVNAFPKHFQLLALSEKTGMALVKINTYPDL